MPDTVFLAGAAGAIGRCLVPLLRAEGLRVVGTTRSEQRAVDIRENGAEAVVVDVYDAAALALAVKAARPRFVIHQLTDLPRNLSPSQLDAARANNARIRDEGTRNLIAAAVAAGAERLIAQSIAFAYAEGPRPYAEDAPLDTGKPGTAGVTARGVASLEYQVLAAPLQGIVLRYGRLYGPGTGVDVAPKDGPVHVMAAAKAAVAALHRGDGVYNIAEDDGFVDVGKAARQLGLRG